MSTSSKPTVKAEIKITVLNRDETGLGYNVEVHGATRDIIYGIARGAVQICELLDIPVETYLTACRLAEVAKPDQEVVVGCGAARGSKKEDQA